MRVLLFCVVATTLFASDLSGQTKYPKREFRGAWLATVASLDWPTSSAPPSSQQTALIGILDKLRANGINAVIFQIRPECDALYPSAIEPWSRWLTGAQGVAPNPLWDPLQFAIDESHKRGMELHAWFNPYRAEKTIGAYALAASHVVKMHPDWILTFPSSTLKILNPGLQQVRDYVASVTADIVRRYNVDGLHADDYFYPYSPKISWEDTATFRQNNRGFTNINDWRRDNVNLLMKAVMDSILAIRPYVKFGMSPFGIWKNGTPTGISGMDNYNDLFADPVAWMQNKWVDYITPQLYWKFGGSQDYAKLCSWWATVLNGRHFYTGNAPYRVTDGSFSATEMPRQMRYNRTVPGVGGAIHFRANDGINNNPQGFADSLKNDLYKYPAFPPTMPWKDSIPPLAPSSLAAVPTAGVAIILTWKKPLPASDTDTAKYYVVYRAQVPDTINFDDPRYIRAIIPDASMRYVDLFTVPPDVRYTYAVTAFDKLNNESATAATTTIPTGVQNFAVRPDEFHLVQNYPNPFNPATTITYSLAAAAHTTLKVYDLLGREIATLAEGPQDSGMYSVRFDASRLASGVYLYRLVSGSYSDTKRMVFQK